MSSFAPHLAWIQAQQDEMCDTVARWAAINTHTYYVSGLEQCMGLVREAFAPLADSFREVPLVSNRTVNSLGQIVARPLANVLHLSRRPEARRRVFLAIHLDTVYPPEDPFQEVKQIDADTLHGPGVADAKGGLVVLLTALRAFEQSPLAGKIGWDVLINTDEEVGSPGSSAVMGQICRDSSIALLFEPALPDGALVCQRKGSGSFTATMSGRSAHVGRDPHHGRNAIHALARFVTELNDLNSPGVIVNTGLIAGGGPVNVVPDRAICRFNIRVNTPEEQRLVEHDLEDLQAEFSEMDGLSLAIEGSFTAPPKPLNGATQKLLDHFALCALELGFELTWRPTGGVCDGNRLAAAGIPTVDSLGPIGRDLHSPREALQIRSLAQRANLTALLLFKLAAGELEWPERINHGAMRTTRAAQEVGS